MESDERILKDPAPMVALAELADSSVNFVVRPWVKGADYWDVKFDLPKKSNWSSMKMAFPFRSRKWISIWIRRPRGGLIFTFKPLSCVLAPFC